MRRTRHSDARARAGAAQDDLGQRPRGEVRHGAYIHPFKISHNVQALIVTAAAQQVNGGLFFADSLQRFVRGFVSGVLGDELAGEGMGEKGGRELVHSPAHVGQSRLKSVGQREQHLHSPHALLLLGDARALESTARWRRPRTAAIVVRSTGRAMAGKFLELAFTDSVRNGAAALLRTRAEHPAAAQARSAYGRRSRSSLPSRDSFYMATITENGWPYLQHRGGAKGFLRVTGPNELMFADHGGNRQMIASAASR